MHPGDLVRWSPLIVNIDLTIPVGEIAGIVLCASPRHRNVEILDPAGTRVETRCDLLEVINEYR